jgi:hypothetical protein
MRGSRWWVSHTSFVRGSQREDNCGEIVVVALLTLGFRGESGEGPLQQAGDTIPLTDSRVARATLLLVDFGDWLMPHVALRPSD